MNDTLRSSEKRRLATWIFTDVVGFSALAESNEALAQELIVEHRAIVRRVLIKRNGVEHHTAGDGFFLEFPSVVDAFEFALELQQVFADRNLQADTERQIQIRIGMHVGDAIVQSGEILGHEVNIAARIQQLAPTGGICLTKATYSFVADRFPKVKFIKVKRTQLKNITTQIKLYCVESPKKFGSQSLKSRVFGLNFKKSLLPLSYIAATLVFLIIAGRISTSYIISIPEGEREFSQELSQTNRNIKESRSPASDVDATEKIDLLHDWQYKKEEGQQWLSFDPESSWIYSNDLFGSYELRKVFRASHRYSQPGMILGLFPGSSRVFLNGQFIGGSNRLNDMGTYFFDPSLLKLDADNEVRVKITSGLTLNPGLTSISDNGTFLGEFSEVKRVQMNHEIHYLFYQNIYFSVTTLVWLLSVVFCVASRGKPTYIYLSFYILLGDIFLGYYNPIIYDLFRFDFMKFVKVFAITTSPWVLLAGYFNDAKRHKIEWAIHLSLLVWVAWVATRVLDHNKAPLDIVESCNTLLEISAGMLVLSFFYGIYNLNLAGGGFFLKRLIRFQNLFPALVLLNLIVVIGSVKDQNLNRFLTLSVRSIVFDLSLFAPFLNSLLVIGFMSSIGYFRNNVYVRRKERDQWVGSIRNKLNSSNNAVGDLAQVQASLCEILAATRSSIYRVDTILKPTTLNLVSSFFHPTLNPESNPYSKAETLNIKKGLFGYVFENQSSLLIHDLAEQRYFVSKKETYSTPSCMVFPMISHGQFLGVLTFADKLSGESFNADDFALVTELQPQFALLLWSLVAKQNLKAS